MNNDKKRKPNEEIIEPSQTKTVKLLSELDNLTIFDFLESNFDNNSLQFDDMITECDLNDISLQFDDLMTGFETNDDDFLDVFIKLIL